MEKIAELRDDILAQVVRRVQEQYEERRGPDDEVDYRSHDWLLHIVKQVGDVCYYQDEPKFRAAMLDIAAIAVAAIECYDQQAAVNKFLGVTEKPVGSGFLSWIAEKFQEVERNGTPVETMHMHVNTLTLLAAAGSAFDPVTDRALVKSGHLGHLWGADVRVDNSLSIGSVQLAALGTSQQFKYFQ